MASSTILVVNKFFLLLVVFLLFPSAVFATIGVGVGSGKIVVDEKLKPGIIYELPPLTILNTGDEPSEYEAAISYHEQQPQHMPPESWFTFSPKEFSLEPGQAQVVNIRLSVPVRAEPGEYFAYLEGHPKKRSQAGSATIGVAAAAKLYFTVVPANFLEGLYYKGLSMYRIYAPWPQRIGLLGAGILTMIVLSRFLNIQIAVKKPHKSHSHQPEDAE